MPPMKNRSVLLAALLGLSSVTAFPLAQPQPVQASMARQEVRIDRLKSESYAAFVSRSELIARAAIQRTFDRDILTSTIVVYIIGLHQGAEAPTMSVEVTRSQWQRRPDVRQWATYYRMAQTLLGFGYSAVPILQGPDSPALQTSLVASIPDPSSSLTPLPLPSP